MQTNIYKDRPIPGHTDVSVYVVYLVHVPTPLKTTENNCFPVALVKQGIETTNQ